MEIIIPKDREKYLIHIREEGEILDEEDVVLNDDDLQFINALYTYNRKITFTRADLEAKVCQELNVTIDDIKSKSRKREVVFARDIIWYILYVKLHYASLASVAWYYHKDHATALHGVKQCMQVLDCPDEYLYPKLRSVMIYFKIWVNKEHIVKKDPIKKIIKVR